jgi:aryl-alcohol dehydrogenase-like predicted oxidoreductase
MEYRAFGRTGWQVSAIGTGTWAMGSLWGPVDGRESLAALNRAVDLGVNFFDTADAYGSEPLLGQLRRQRRESIYIATKIGMGVNPDPRGYNRKNIEGFVDGSLRKLGVETLDLLHLHCPPIEVYNPEVFGILDDLVKAGKIRFYGASVERISEALKAIEFPNVQSLQLVFNMFRQRPIDDLFPETKRRRVAIVARVPLASGMLTGKLTRQTKFARDDHRNFNRDGSAFDRGETFSGVDFEVGLASVDELRPLVPEGWSMAQMALRWILMFDDVACTIPGAKRPAQVEDNVRAASLPPLSEETMAAVRSVYDRHIRKDVHHVW